MNGGLGPGVSIIIVSCCVALGFLLVSNPVAAVLVMLVVEFFRAATPTTGLPAEPFVIAFFGAIGSAVLAAFRRSRGMPQLGVVELAMGLYIAWNITSAIAPHEFPSADSLTGVAMPPWRLILTGILVPFTMYIIGRWMFDRKSSVDGLLWIIVGLTGISVIVSILQILGLSVPFVPTYSNDPSTTWDSRAVGVFNQPVVNGLVMTIGFAAAIYLASQRGNAQWKRLIAYIVAASSVCGIYVTYTRIAWITFGVALLMGVILGRGMRRGFAVVLVGVAVVLAANWTISSSDGRAASRISSESEIHDRLNGAATSLWAIQERPLLGWGIGRFSQVNTYHHQQWSQDINWVRGYGYTSHENELGIAAELGLIGLALWLTILTLVVRRLITAYRAARHPGNAADPGLALVAVIAMTTWCATGVTNSMTFYDFANGITFLLVGVVVGQHERSRHVSRIEPGPTTGETPDETRFVGVR